MYFRRYLFFCPFQINQSTRFNLFQYIQLGVPSLTDVSVICNSSYRALTKLILLVHSQNVCSVFSSSIVIILIIIFKLTMAHAPKCTRMYIYEKRKKRYIPKERQVCICVRFSTGTCVRMRLIYVTRSRNHTHVCTEDKPNVRFHRRGLFVPHATEWHACASKRTRIRIFIVYHRGDITLYTRNDG